VHQSDFFIVFLAIRDSFPIFACTNQISLSCFWQFVVPSPSSRAPIRFLYRVSGNSWFLPHLRVHQSDFLIVFLAIRGSFPIFACTNQISLSCFWQFVVPSQSSRAPINATFPLLSTAHALAAVTSRVSPREDVAGYIGFPTRESKNRFSKDYFFGNFFY
jgi:hypothetical protein